MIRKKRVLSLLIALAVMVSAAGLVPTTLNALGTGKVFLLGGAMSDDNAEVYNALRTAAGGGTPRIAVICSGAPSYADAYDAYYNDITGSLSYQHLFQKYGFEPVFIPAALDNYTVEAYRQANIDLINTCTAVFFNGGDQSRHARCLLKNDGTDTPLMTAVRGVYDRGGVITGTSAGAAVQSDPMYGEGVSYGYMKANRMVQKQIVDISLADPSNSNNGGYCKAFGFTALWSALADTHFDARGRLGRVLVALRETGKSLGIGLDENTGFCIAGDIGTVYGANGVFLVDGSGASYPAGTYFTTNNMRVSYLTSGDTYTWSTKTIVSTKAAVQPNATVYSSRDIFSANECSKVMTALVKSNATYATGNSKESKPRFTLKFSKDGSTKGYYNAGTGKYTIDKLLLQVSYQ